MRLVEQSLRDLLAAFASADPTPGGGSAAAAGAAIGASLLRMVAGLPKTRNGSDEDRAALIAVASALTAIQQQLTDAIDEDTAAYDAVVAAYRQPKTTDAEQSARKSAIQRALRGAIDVPLRVMRHSADALVQAKAVAAHGHRGAASDVGVAAALLRAGLHGARLNVEINLEGIVDAAYKDAAAAEMNRIAAGGAQAAADVDATLG